MQVWRTIQGCAPGGGVCPSTILGLSMRGMVGVSSTNRRPHVAGRVVAGVVRTDPASPEMEPYRQTEALKLIFP